MNPAYNREQVASIISEKEKRPGPMLPILHAIQDALGYIPPESVGQIADALNLSRAEVHGVITFYHDFITSPPADHTVRVCRAEACQSMGAEKLAKHIEQKLAHRKPGEFEVKPVYCLGLCANSPALMIDDVLHARVTPGKFDQLIRKGGKKG